jgi:sirohydrochlorin cobaltochelatase
MSVAGDHAKNDMAGDAPDSWRSILTAKGFKVEPVLRGTAEIPEIVDIWLDHLEAAAAGSKEP